MKTFVLVICLLTVAHARDCKQQEKVYHMQKECEAELPECKCGPKNVALIPDVWNCTLSKMKIIDENGIVKMKEGMEFCNMFGDPANNNCKKMICQCMEERKTAKEMSAKEMSAEEETRIAMECVMNQGLGGIMKSEINDCRKLCNYNNLL